MLKVSPYLEEVRVEMAQKHTLMVLEGRFPGRVPAAIVERINAETNLAELEKWLKLAVNESFEEFQKRLA